MNPYYEKWGRGRPSKEKIRKRKLSDEWAEQYIKQNPGGSFLSFVFDSNNMSLINNPIMKSIVYIPRLTE